MGFRAIVLAAVLATALAGVSGSADSELRLASDTWHVDAIRNTAPDDQLGVWTPFVPTFVLPNQGRYNTQQWHAQPVDDPATGRTIIFDRVNDDVRSLYPSSIYANAFIGIDPAAQQVGVMAISNYRVVPCKPALPEYPCKSPTLTYETQPIPETAPTYADGHPLAGNLFDPEKRILLRVNGANTSVQPYTGDRHPAQTWAIDLNTGVQRLIADARRGDAQPAQDVGDYSCGIFDPHAKKYLYFDVTNTGMDVWVLDLSVANSKWILRPRDRSAANIWKSVTGCAYDSKRHRVLMVGGGRNIYQPLGGGDPLPEAEADVHPSRRKFHAYSYETNRWEELPPIPHSPNIAPEAAYSPVHDVLLVVVRQEATDTTEMRFDTWAFTFADNTWRRVNTGFGRGKVGVRGHSGTVAWNSRHGLFVMTGGIGPAPVFATLRYGNVTAPPPPPPPTEVCGNKLDDDHDGQIDEDCAPLPPPPDPDPDAALQPGPTPHAVPAIGVGCTSAYFIDKDCDGYGHGVRANGVYGVRAEGLGDKPDADDTDPAIHTPASVLTAYDADKDGTLSAAELKAFLRARRAYSVKRIFYIATTGNNATGAPDNPSRPFATYHSSVNGVAGLWRFLQPGDAVVWRSGTYTEGIGSCCPYLASGEPGSPIVLTSAPGERVVFAASKLSLWKTHDIIVDGFGIDSPSPGFGNGLVMSESRNVTVRRIEIQRFNFPSGMQDIHNLLIEEYLSHHQKEHGLYLGSDSMPNENITLRNSIIYGVGLNAKYGAFQHNGRVTKLRVENNIFHSTGQWGISFAMGVTNSIVQNNLIFNIEGHGIILQMYPGHGEEKCAIVGGPYICPYTQTGNLITNNTIWIGKKNLTGAISSSPGARAGILMGRNDLGTPGDGKYSQGSNTVQNNVFVTESGPAIREVDDVNGAPEWLGTWTIRNNVVFRRAGTGADICYGDEPCRSIAAFGAQFSGTTGNMFADPKLVAVNIDFWNTPHLFNFTVQAGSPAIRFGTATGAPLVDLRGVSRVSPPDAGAYAFGDGASGPPAPTGLRIIR